MKKTRYFLYLIVSFVICSCSVADAQSVGIVQFKQKITSEVIEISVPSLASRKVFIVPDPERLVVDVPTVPSRPVVSLPSDYKGKLIKAARFGQFDPKTARFVFDLTQNIKVVSTNVEGKKLIVEIVAAPAGSTPAKSAKDKTQKPVQAVVKEKKEAFKETKRSNGYKQPKSNQPPLIIIDAGHGGVDPGTIADDGTQEKDVVLEYALALKAKLVKLKKYRVRLTRSDDEFIMLRERVAIARRANANLFVSIHADSAEGISARGLSVYTVSEKSSDKEAEALAQRENKSDIIAGMDLSDEKPEVADILISLAQRETKNNSADFADYLVMNLGDRVRMLPNPHRFAGFAVLKAPDIPSVLVEVGFLSHPEEEKEIKSKAYRTKVVDGITSGIEQYFSKKLIAQDGL